MLIYNRVLWIIFVVLQLCISIPLLAQINTDTLKEVKIHGKHKISGDTKINDFSPGQKVKTIDSATLQQYELQNMANLLTQQVPVFVKSYGFNGLATLSFRGASSAQSAVYWNGVPIQNAALGIADVSTLPVLFMNKVNIVYGGSSALWGSGNVGGALLLENDMPVFDTSRETLSFSGGIGSFSQYIGGLKGSISGKRWFLSANVFAQTARNNFSYTDQAGAKTGMPNSHLQSEAAMLQGAYKLAAQNVISLTAWYQQYDREIPPALYESYSDKKQIDGSLRLLADWKKETANNTWYAKSSFIRDEISYDDKAITILAHTDNVVYQYYQETGWKKQLRKYGQFLLFVPVQISWINLPDSNTTKAQDKIAIAGAYDLKFINNRLDVSVNARGEVINTQSIFLPGADAAYSITDWLVVRANAQRTYRAPTLNELYYFPGGNASLRPEQGWNEDAGYTAKLKTGRLTLFHDGSLFNRNIHDWILWIGGAIWTPHNIAEVHSRGIETENNITYALGKWQFHVGVNTAYLLSTTVNSYIQNDGSVGKQIPYTPRYYGQLNIGFSYRQVSFNYNHTYTGYRFTTTDESEYILPYQTGNVQLMYNTAIRYHSLQLTAQCNNIWNEQYQVVTFRPMPGVNWLIGFKVGIL